jgi:hypothetical protein
LAFAIFALAFAWPYQAGAASVARVGTIDLVDNSRLVFHGTVLSHLVGRSAETGDIVTRVTFDVHDTLKGRPPGDMVELQFLGGSLNGETLSVSDLTVPPIGEEGIFFVEQLDHPQVNPLYGWWQGEFLVRHDAAGRKVVHTHELEPVYDFAPRTALERRGLSVGAAEGVVTSPAVPSAPALSLDDFKSRLRGMLGNGR